MQSSRNVSPSSQNPENLEKQGRKRNRKKAKGPVDHVEAMNAFILKMNKKKILIIK